MGILICIVIITIYIYGVILLHKKGTYPIISTISFILMIIQLMSVLENPSIPYNGLPIEEFSSQKAYEVAVCFYYIGFFIWSIVALCLIYIPILKNKKKDTQDK